MWLSSTFLVLQDDDFQGGDGAHVAGLNRASVCARAVMVPAAYVVAPVPSADGLAAPDFRHIALFVSSQQPSHFCPQNARYRTPQNVTSLSLIHT